MKRLLNLVPAILLSTTLAATLGLNLSTAASETAAGKLAESATATAEDQSAAVPVNMTPRVLLQTSVGTITLELDRKRAPESVANFLAYVESDFYNGTIFHRVIDGFMIQGGGFTADFQKKKTLPPIRNEANNGLKNRRLSIAMARTNAPHSATSQFFINTEDNTNLDHKGPTPRGWGYAVFGRVVDGQDIVDKISQVSTGPGGPFSRDAPREPIVINEIAIIDATEPDEDGAEPSKSSDGLVVE